MKLITEYTNDNLEYLTEENDGKKSLHIEGIFMMADVKNRNGRVYPKKVMENAVKKYTKQYVDKGRAVGELDHPQTGNINLDKVSHLITELKWEGNNVMGKAKILETPMGQIAKGLMEGGVQLGVSSRGMGSLVTKNGVNEVSNDFVLNTVDIVADPSAHEAFVNGIMESVDWEFKNGAYVPTTIHGNKVDKVIKTLDTDKSIKMFKDLLNKM